MIRCDVEYPGPITAYSNFGKAEAVSLSVVSLDLREPIFGVYGQPGLNPAKEPSYRLEISNFETRKIKMNK